MHNTSENGRRRARVLATVAAVVLACSGTAAVAIGIAAQDPAPSSPPGGQAADSQSDAPAASSDSDSDSNRPKDTGKKQSKDTAGEPEPVVDELKYSAPVRIDIPKIGVSASLVDLGLDEEGVMETPQVAEKAGWFTPSPPPGIPGATVISGHVTYNGPAVFLKLGDLRRGDRVEVEREDGVTTLFEVSRIGSFPKEGFPTDAVYSQPEGSELRLITCGGKYDEANNRYLSNVIVWAKIVGADQA
ncbi:MAG: class F sortase [Actinomycetota bacterium]|nr:class F sortase [Actinomycetota bacterium]